MTAAQALDLARRFQAWRRGTDERTMAAADLHPQQIGEALDLLIAAAERLPRLEGELARTRTRLQKCYTDRARLHLQLRRATAALAAATTPPAVPTSPRLSPG